MIRKILEENILYIIIIFLLIVFLEFFQKI
nr:MAG TPA: hypothetical protein [Caudoviricetes sp.]